MKKSNPDIVVPAGDASIINCLMILEMLGKGESFAEISAILDILKACWLGPSSSSQYFSQKNAVFRSVPRDRKHALEINAERYSALLSLSGPDNMNYKKDAGR